LLNERAAKKSSIMVYKGGMRYGNNLLAGFKAEDRAVFRNFIRITQIFKP
jgi:hypothetical protein